MFSSSPFAEGEGGGREGVLFQPPRQEQPLPNPPLLRKGGSTQG